MTYFEDIRIGDKSALGRHTFMAGEIKSFAQRFDPQPFHLDDVAAARSHFGGLIASGWHTAAVCIKLIVEHRRRQEDAWHISGETVPRIGVSPGFRDLKWLKPVYAGDTIAYASEVVEKRTLQSRPDLGLAFSRHTGTNQAGELVFSFVGSVFIERRPG